jgi:accessory gene regulator protein AgrB
MIYRVGINKADFAAFILDLWNCYLQSLLYIGLPTNIDLWNRYYLFFWWGIGLTVWENAGTPENYRYMMNYKYQEKKKEISGNM